MALVKGCGTSSALSLNLFSMIKVSLTNLSNKPSLCWSTSWTKIQIHSSIKPSATLKISKPLQLKLFGTLLARPCRMQTTKMTRLKLSWSLLFSTACLRISRDCNRYSQWLSTGILKSLVKPRRQITNSCWYKVFLCAYGMTLALPWVSFNKEEQIANSLNYYSSKSKMVKSRRISRWKDVFLDWAP